MEVKLLMQKCNYCENHSMEDLLFLKKWVKGSYCSSECIINDMRQHEALINYYDNVIKSIDRTDDELYQARKRKNLLIQKLTLIKSLVKTGKLEY